jgi:hypothetical protein
MDLSFPSLDVAHPYAVPLGLDFQRLIATCAALQAATPTAAVETQLSSEHLAPVRPVDALVALLAGRPGWTASIAVLGGSFSPEAARYASDKVP